MKPSTRLHIYPPNGPRDTAYIVADRSALKTLAQAINNATTSAAGFETARFYSADGHEYNIIITSEIDEQEWQTLESHYVRTQTPTVSTIQNYQELKRELEKNTHD
jgi:hypothetical protein